MGKRLITMDDVRQAAAAGRKTISAPPQDCIVTPMAWDEADALGVLIEIGSQPAPEAPADGPPAAQADDVVSQVCDIIKHRLPAGVNEGDLERLVRNVVGTRLAAAAIPTPSDQDPALTRLDGVCLVDSARLLRDATGAIPTTEKVWVADALRCTDDAKLAGCYMAWEKASFNRTVDFPEIGIVIDGELHVTVGGRTVVGKPGDMLYFPKGAEVLYSTPTRVKMACVDCVR